MDDNTKKELPNITFCKSAEEVSNNINALINWFKKCDMLWFDSSLNRSLESGTIMIFTAVSSNESTIAKKICFL